MEQKEPTREELIRHVGELNAELAELRARVREATDQADFMGGSLKKRTALLSERVKELECVTAAIRIVRDPDLGFEQRVGRVVDLLPKAWQSPDAACARAVIGGKEYRTARFAPSEWVLAEPVTERGAEVGLLEVRYLVKRPDADEGPFLKEERALLRAVAACLGGLCELQRPRP